MARPPADAGSMARPVALQSSQDVATAFATALQADLGRDTPFTVEAARELAEVDTGESAPVFALPFLAADDISGLVAFVAVAELEVAYDASFAAAISALAEAGASDAAADGELLELDVASLTGETVVAYPLLDGTDLQGAFVVVLGDDLDLGDVDDNPAASAGNANPLVLVDVEMGVTAELGRSHMTLREFLSITQGDVIDLDRAIGAPVDLLVNGTAIARGEVVVVDDEFGVRITEILNSRATAV
jgi:flagellar motor switch protein FliN/FliY